jgi:hypothetical protein
VHLLVKIVEIEIIILEIKYINFFIRFPASYFIYLRIGPIVNGGGMSQTAECSFLNDIEQIQ